MAPRIARFQISMFLVLLLYSALYAACRPFESDPIETPAGERTRKALQLPADAEVTPAYVRSSLLSRFPHGTPWATVVIFLQDIPTADDFDNCWQNPPHQVHCQMFDLPRGRQSFLDIVFFFDLRDTLTDIKVDYIGSPSL
jgi:hypothetical protein